MKRFFLLLILCTSLQAQTIELTEEQADFVAMKVWQNEGAGLDKYLVHWNDGEDFASVGIGHFIWFSEDHQERFHEMFPEVLAFLEAKEVEMPEWLNAKTPLPWNSKEDLSQAKKTNSKKFRQLFELLKSTKGYQADFLAQRLSLSLPKMLNALENAGEQNTIKRRFNNILKSKDGTIDERGLYALLDYVNFKGEGTVSSERYNHQGWGLLQVLVHMEPTETNKLKAFAESADAMLTRRIRNSPLERGEIRWKENWHNRVMSYWN